MKYLSSPAVQKLAILALYGFVGFAIQKGYLPAEAKTFLAEHSLEAILIAFGVGHVAPEAAAKK